MEQPQKILSLAALRAVEHARPDAAPPLMERAGAAAAEVALRLIAGHTGPLLIVAGPGNNGGDAFVVARLLFQRGLDARVVFAGESARLPTEARAAHDAWIACGGSILAEIPDGHPFSLAVDGLLGIGLKRPLEGRMAALVKRINALPCPVLALDIPSGLDSETGCVLGTAVRASHTASFIALKPGLLTLDGPDHCGAISVHDLDVDVELNVDGGLTGFTITPALFSAQLRPRLKNSHKGSYGSAGILGGAPGMAGAVLLAGRAALQLGAGRVYVGVPERLPVDLLQPELMLRDADELFSLASCLAIGPGLGQSDAALSLLRRSVDCELPLIVDADAINLLAEHPVLLARLARRAAATLLTPHPAEAARLLGSDVASVQADRITAALDLAERSQACVVLKGCGSVVALPDGRWFINTTGNPGLASAGTGDVLTGFIISLLAQGWPADQALLAAVHLHGAAADACVAAGIGPIGLTAGELPAKARWLLNGWVRD